MPEEEVITVSTAETVVVMDAWSATISMANTAVLMKSHGQNTP